MLSLYFILANDANIILQGIQTKTIGWKINDPDTKPEHGRK